MSGYDTINQCTTHVFVPFRFPEDQLKMRADDVASSLRSRPANVEELAKKITADRGKLLR